MYKPLLNSIWLTLFITALFIFNSSFSNNPFSKKELYIALSDSSIQKIDSVFTKLESTNESPAINAYKGALLMKRASLIKVPKEKLNAFKKGKLLLESEIEKDPQNAEYRFLRLSIQENAPKVLNYHDNISEDKAVIVNKYKTLDDELKMFILDYSEDSKFIKSSDLK